MIYLLTCLVILNINNLLVGDSNLPDCENESNFLIIQDFIIKSKRFTPSI